MAPKPVSEPKVVTPAPAESSSSAAAAAVAAGENTYPAVKHVLPISNEGLQEQLAAAKAQIAKLTSQLSDPQLRQRKVQEASEMMQTVVQQSNESGVPVQIVAGLCLLSFLIGYLFF